MPRYRIVEKWEYEETYIVTAATEADALEGGSDMLLAGRDDGEYCDTLSVELLEGDEANADDAR